jgi:hypothetical protein
VRPERLFGLRPHPFGVALRAINLACGQVVELGLFVCREFELSRRVEGTYEGLSGKEIIGAPGEIRTPGLLVRSQALYPTELRARKGREYYHINWPAPFRRNLARKECGPSMSAQALLPALVLILAEGLLVAPLFAPTGPR